MIWCFAKKLYTRRDTGVGRLSWWSCQSPVAHSCGLLNHPNSFRRGMLKLNPKFDADSLLYLLSHFECDKIRTVHMLTQRCLLPPLTSTVKLLLFTHVHSSPLSLAGRLHWCCTNHSCYFNNGRTFFQAVLIYQKKKHNYRKNVHKYSEQISHNSQKWKQNKNQSVNEWINEGSASMQGTTIRPLKRRCWYMLLHVWSSKT